ncbi:cytochrome c3 family protein [Mesorhizobium retamae]|uniref:Cytochrome c family protein n=1 Tax=Mesorhizobium retamae TaxID=2912854 RepID=A0ABS9QGH3_9HYPH|nr:cytochrome c3 family protein [Mesorhizobium sp. IRAMC:0171]MCG7505933.1 cytochrome c family protein [Mesorhizobium sp. IRAMC:0171]
MKLRAKWLQRLAGHAGRVGLLLLAGGAVVLLWQPTEAAWWAARLLGVAALLLISGTLFLRPAYGQRPWHRLFGWAALAALGGHVVVTTGFQPVFWRWLTPAMPLEIVAGIIALLAFLMVLLVQRSRTLRRRLGPFSSLSVHRTAGYLLIAAACTHITLVAGMAFSAAVGFLSGLAFLLVEGLLRERHVVRLAATLALFISAIAWLAIGSMAETRLAGLRQAPIDHARFLHTDHTGLACAGCHHNFVDRTGTENCLSCHKRLSVSEASRIDSMFHAFCSECHRADNRAGRKFGPIDDCNGCHGG